MAQTVKRKLLDPATKLEIENAALKRYVRALKSETAKLQTKYAKLEAKQLSTLARVKALEKLKTASEPKRFSDLEVARRIAFLLNKGGLDIHGNPISRKK